MTTLTATEPRRFKPAAFAERELSLIDSVLRDHSPKRTYLEIGSRNGESLGWFGERMDEGAKLVAVDLPEAGWGQPGSEEKLLRTVGEMRARGFVVRPTIGDSHDQWTRDNVAGDLADVPVDVLLIDGDHTYQGVRQDIADYAPLVRQGGIVIFHDCGLVKAKGCTHDKPKPYQTMEDVSRAVLEFAVGREYVLCQSAWGVCVVWM